MILRPAAIGYSSLQVLTNHSAPCRVTSTAPCNLTPSMHTRSCNHVCGCRVQYRRSGRRTGVAALLPRSQAAWGGQVPCCPAALSCGALQPAMAAPAHGMRACTSGRSAADVRTRRRTGHASTGAEPSVLQRRLTAERRSRRGQRASGSASVVSCAGHCQQRRAGLSAATAARQSTVASSSCGGASRGGSRASSGGSGRGGRAVTCCGMSARTV